MKRLIYIIAAVLTITFASNTQAQNGVPEKASEVITITANLKTSIAMSMDKSPIIFDFVTLEDYKNGFSGKKTGKHVSVVLISSTSNWNLSCKAQSEFKNVNSGKMSLDNVGLTVENYGTNKVKSYAKDQPLALSKAETVILGHDGKNSNAGYFQDNSIVVFWEMGTRKGNMNNQSIFEQDLKKGSYSTNVEFVATEVL